jgi:oligosaccharide translocation protein RFT1
MGIVFDMELYSATVLFLSRESIRMALLRNPSKSSNSLQLCINMAFIPPIIGILLMGLMYFYSLSEQVTDFKWRVLVIYSWATLVELMVEPMYIYASTQFLYPIRVWSEATAFVSQVLSTFVQFLLLNNGQMSVEDGVRAHARSQLIFALVLFGSYYSRIQRHQLPKGISLFYPKRVPKLTNEKVYFDKYLVDVSISFMGQTFLKHLLTVGDKLVLVVVGIESAQKGAYRMVSDLGS